MKSLQSLYKSTRISNSAANQTELMQCCLATIKTTMAVIQKSAVSITEELKNGESDTRYIIKVFMELSWSILSDNVFVADCRSAAGMAIPLAWKVLPNEDVTLAHKVFHVMNGDSMLHIVDDKTEKSYQTLDNSFNELSPSSQLFMCHGILAMLPVKDLIEINGNMGCLLLDVILPKILHVTESSNSSSTTLAASRTLTLWTTVALSTVPDVDMDVRSMFVGTASIPQRILQYVWTNWDHPVDGMRHQTRIIFENIITLHRHVTSIDSTKDPFLLSLLQDLMAASWHIRGKYGPLGCLTQHLGAEKILELYPTIHHTVLDMLGEQTLVPYACDLLAKLFTCHLKALTSIQGQGDGLSKWQGTWILPALTLLCDPSKPKQHKGFLVEYHVPKLLKFSPESLTYIVEHLQNNNDLVTSDQLGALLICLKTARTLGLIETSRAGDIKDGMWKGLVSFDVLEQALSHSNSQVQLNALGLLCDSNKTTEQFSADELRLLSSFLSLNMNNSSPSFRQQMSSHLKKMLIRLRESGRLLSKQTSSSKRSSSGDSDDTNKVTSQITLYKNFVHWFSEFQFTNLEPGSSYPRRATALYILTMVVQIFNSPNKQGKQQTLFITQDMWTPSHVQLMMMRLTDNYETNKVMAFDLLKDLSQETLGLLNKSHLDSLYDCSLELASSNKPHYCESASYFLRVLARQLKQPLKMAATSQEQCIMGFLEDLCKLLNNQINVAKESLLEASVQGPMYGIMHCIRQILCDVKFGSVAACSKWRAMLLSIIRLCFDVAQISSTVVCNSSPEGYLPSESNSETASDVKTEQSSDQLSQDKDEDTSSEVEKSDEVTTFQVTPQMVLVCCWRSMKEVSLLLGQLALDVPVCLAEDGGTDGLTKGLITEKQILDIGELFLQLLKESKHRGAFELAYVGFVKLCTNLWRSNIQSLCQLPEQWLEGLMNDVTSDQPMLCATRRSAGIPFAIQALLNSEPVNFSKQHFKSVMSRLLNLALPDADSSQVSSTSQVHALNILRALYRDTHHGEDVFPYVSDGVRAAIVGFQAKLWAVRNSATMLFSALITRIFGVKKGKEEQARKNCMTGREFFSRFPALHGFLLTQLKEAAQKIDSSAKAHLHPALFPVLLLLSRLYPSAMDGSDSSLSMAVFVPHILRCAGSAVYKTRCIAARALVAVVPGGQIPDMIKQLLETLPEDSQLISSSHERICHNYIHGVLLQIQCLLEAHIQSGNLSSSPEMQMNVSSVLAQVGKCLWLATRHNPCYVTRSAMLITLNTIISDQFWMKTSSSGRRDSCADTLLKLNTSLWSIVSSNIAEAADAEDAHQQLPGYIEWQISNVQLYLKIQDAETPHETPVETLMETPGYLCEKEVHGSASIEKNFGELQISGSCNNPEDENAILKGCRNRSRSNLDNTQKSKPCETDDRVIKVVSNLISSPHYEVRELTLGTLLNDRTCTLNDASMQGDITETCKTNLWSKVIHSDDIFHVLVAVVIGNGKEDHPACIEKALLLLSSHHLSHTFPWVLPGGAAISCLDCFNKILQVANQENQRDEIVCAAIRMTSSLIPLLCNKVENMTESTTQALHTWSNLLDDYSQPEHSNQCREVVAETLSKLAGIVMVDHHQLLGFQIPFRLWSVVMRLLQDDDIHVQLAACHTVKQAISALPNKSHLAELLPLSADFQPTLAIRVGLCVMSSLYVPIFPQQYLQTMVAWLIGSSEEGSILGTSSALLDDQNEQIPEDRLFDRGEANTNFERLLLGKAVLEHLEVLAAALTDQTDVDIRPATDADPCQSTSSTSNVKEINIGRAYYFMDHSVSRKAQGNSGANLGVSKTGGLHPVGLECCITPTSRQDLVTATKEVTGKIMLAVEQFLYGMSDVNLTTPYLYSTDYEMNCVECWSLLSALKGLGSFMKLVDGNCPDDIVAKRGQLLEHVVTRFGGEHCNSLIMEVVNDIKSLR
ncbi:tRNA (32-2'-O)-methyltransferase regulator THADA-like [Amphiura filiformis]|uniref:tRNA (32-2'-O)-methyltransferase regulator THADA-like n=1 Tax=Amphiura filiformis TaxID=82378 RepID=UPI003B20FBBA